MASGPPPIVKKGNYKIWRAVDEHVINLENVSNIKFSPCTSLVGLVTQQKFLRVMLVNYRTKSCEELLEYVSDFLIEDIKWSSNSEALLIFSLKSHQFVVVQNVKKFDEGSLFRVQEPQSISLISIEWVPDNKHLISVSDYNIFTFVHSLCDGRRMLLPSIKTRNRKPLMAFSCNGKYLVFIHYTASADHVVLMSTSSWTVLWKRKSEFFLIQGLDWSPNASVLAVWDNSKRVSFFEVNGDVIQTVHYHDPLASGFVTIMFSATCDLFLAVCFRDKVVLILVYNIFTWHLGAVLDHERDSNEDLSYSSVMSKIGFSNCGNFLASSVIKGSVFIWNTREGFKLSTVISTQNNSAGLKWHPSKTELAISTDNGIAFVWKHPQGGPTDKKPSIYSAMCNLPCAAGITWSKKNVILSTMGPVQGAVILVKEKKRKTAEIY